MRRMDRSHAAWLAPALALAVLLVTFGPLRPARGAGQMRLLDQVEFEYRDHHEGGRLVAMIGLTLVRQDSGRAVLSVQPRAEAPGLDPLPGYRGVRGTNLKAAREMGGLVAEGALELRVRPVDGDESSALTGVLLDVQRKQLPERSLTPDGRVDFDAQTQQKHVVSLRLMSKPMAPGRYLAEVTARGVPRLSIELEYDGEAGRVLNVRGQAEPGETQLDE